MRPSSFEKIQHVQQIGCPLRRYLILEQKPSIVSNQSAPLARHLQEVSFRAKPSGPWVGVWRVLTLVVWVLVTYLAAWISSFMATKTPLSRALDQLLEGCERYRHHRCRLIGSYNFYGNTAIFGQLHGIQEISRFSSSVSVPWRWLDAVMVWSFLLIFDIELTCDGVIEGLGGWRSPLRYNPNWVKWFGSWDWLC